MSMRLGTSRDLDRRANVRRVRRASAAAKERLLRGSGVTGPGEGRAPQRARPAKIAQQGWVPGRGSQRSRTPPGANPRMWRGAMLLGGYGYSLARATLPENRPFGRSRGRMKTRVSASGGAGMQHPGRRNAPRRAILPRRGTFARRSGYAVVTQRDPPGAFHSRGGPVTRPSPSATRPAHSSPSRDPRARGVVS